jgi:hypothetical protein
MDAVEAAPRRRPGWLLRVLLILTLVLDGIVSRSAVARHGSSTPAGVEWVDGALNRTDGRVLAFSARSCPRGRECTVSRNPIV